MCDTFIPLAKERSSSLVGRFHRDQCLYPSFGHQDNTTVSPRANLSCHLDAQHQPLPDVPTIQSSCRYVTPCVRTRTLRHEKPVVSGVVLLLDHTFWVSNHFYLGMHQLLLQCVHSPETSRQQIQGYVTAP